MKKYKNKNNVVFEDVIENGLWKCRISNGNNMFIYNNSIDFFALRYDLDTFKLEDFKKFIEVKDDCIVDMKGEVIENVEEVDLGENDNLNEDQCKLLDLERELEESNKRLELQKDSPELYKREKKTNSNIKRKITNQMKKMDLK